MAECITKTFICGFEKDSFKERTLSNVTLYDDYMKIKTIGDEFDEGRILNYSQIASIKKMSYKDYESRTVMDKILIFLFALVFAVLCSPIPILSYIVFVCIFFPATRNKRIIKHYIGIVYFSKNKEIKSLALFSSFLTGYWGNFYDEFYERANIKEKDDVWTEAKKRKGPEFF